MNSIFSFEPIFLETTTYWFLQLIGRLHPLVVHFPVSFLLLAGILCFSGSHNKTVRLLTIAGSTSAILASVLGLLLSWQEGMAGELLDYHQYSGLFLALVSIVLLYIVFQNKQDSNLFRILISLGVIGTVVAGHLGASLTHGEDYLTEVLPGNKVAPQDIALNTFSDTLSKDEKIKLVGQVRAVFAHNCYKCHGEVKQKGDLRLDKKEFVFAGGKSGKAVVPHSISESELYRRITLPVEHKEAMPSKGKKISDEEIALVKYWIEKGAPWPENLGESNLFPMAALAPRDVDLPKGDFENPIDLFVNTYFRKNTIAWKPIVSDRVFLRRIYLDIQGILPTFEEIRDFEKDQNPEKREAAVGRLLANNQAYAEHWMTFWNDALRNDYTGTGYITKGRYDISGWLFNSLRNNKPYDLFVKELLNPTEKSKGFIAGIKWRGTVNASQRTEMQAAQNVAQVLLGVNLKCASCHDSFVSNWKLDDAYAFANIFAEEKLEIARCEKPIGKLADTRLLWPSLGKIDSSASRKEKLQYLSQSLVSPMNGRLYRTVVNRIWAQLMGRGIIAAVDEMDNKPWSADLLDWLAVNFVDNKTDLKKLIFLILTSDTYQMQSEAIAYPSVIAKDDYVFRGMLRRRMTAEQFSDGISKVFVPVFQEKALASQLVKAGYEPMGTSQIIRASVVPNTPFLTALGRPNREIVSTQRSSQASLLQALELTNGVVLDSTLKAGAKKWKAKHKTTSEVLNKIYQEALGRTPSEKEADLIIAKLGEDPTVNEVQDLFWSIVTLPEFQIIY